MTTQQRRTLVRSTKHERLIPAKDALNQGTLKEQMRRRLRGTTKTITIIGITKLDQAISSIEDTMCDLPGQVNDRSVQGTEVELSPRGGPIQSTIQGKELFFTVGWDKVGRQKIQMC